MALRFKNEAIKKHRSVFKKNKSGRYDPVLLPLALTEIQNTMYNFLWFYKRFVITIFYEKIYL